MIERCWSIFVYSLLVFPPLPFFLYFASYEIVRAFFFFLRFCVIFTLCAKSNEKKREWKEKEGERERERVNQIAGDVRLWRRTNSIHLGAREYIRWHNRNIRNHKSLSLSFFFLHVVTSGILWFAWFSPSRSNHRQFIVLSTCAIV
jgi:hypothetical protein